MKFRVSLNFRKFNEKEDEDSGYYNSFDSKRHSKIDVRSDDESVEQMLTIYHEVTHMVLDLFTQYEMDDRVKAKVIKRSPRLRNDWRIYNEKSEKKRKDGLSKEEIICAKVEQAVRAVLEKEIPKRFQKQLFTNKKKTRIIDREKKKRRK
jgi:hypothetical protein